MRRRLLGTGTALVAAGSLVTVLASTGIAQDAKAAYDKNCATCHGAGGKGDGAAAKVLKPPPTDFATALKGKSDADIAKAIKDGGKAVGKAASMPAYGAKMNDEQIQGLVQYVKGLAK